MWVWVLSLALLALLVWVVGQRVQERPHVEIGVTGGETPVAVTPTPAPTTVERAERGNGPEESSGGGGGEGVTSEIPVSPAPHR
jgi:hypothetical protein